MAISWQGLTTLEQCSIAIAGHGNDIEESRITYYRAGRAILLPAIDD